MGGEVTSTSPPPVASAYRLSSLYMKNSMKIKVTSIILIFFYRYQAITMKGTLHIRPTFLTVNISTNIKYNPLYVCIINIQHARPQAYLKTYKVPLRDACTLAKRSEPEKGVHLLASEHTSRREIRLTFGMKVLILNTCWSSKTMTKNYTFSIWTENPAHDSSLPVACRGNATASSMRVPPSQYSPYPPFFESFKLYPQKKKNFKSRLKFVQVLL